MSGENQCEDFEVRFCCEKNSTSTNQTTQSTKAAITANETTASYATITVNSETTGDINSTNQTTQSFCQLELPKNLTDLSFLKNEVDGFNISNPSSIGLECESGIIDDCNESSTMEVLPFSCAGILMFSNNSKQTCGSKCDLENNNTMSKEIKPIKTGWTKWIR